MAYPADRRCVVIKADVHLARDGFTLDVQFQADGPALGVFGPSGAGKTTLINLIAGLEQPQRGSITLGTQPLFDSTQNVNVPTHRRRVGVVFQEHRLFPHYSVTGNLLYAARGGGSELDRIVALLELAPLLSRRINQLSGGERQRIALGRALLSGPQLLLLDEPLASLDLRLRRQIIPYLRRVRDELGVPIVYVSHDLTEILQLTDQMLIIERGKSVGCGRYGEIVHTDAVLSVVHDRGMNNVLAARVLEHKADDGVSVLEIGPSEQGGPTGRLFAPLCAAEVGATISISIRPWDIALAAAPVSGVSILNQVCGTVQRCSGHERRMLVDVNIGAPLIVEISRRSATTLNIQTGTPIVCLIKSHSVQYVGAPSLGSVS